MICFIALIVFGVLAIFSASHRPLAKEAFDCVFRKFTFRKCKTNLDQRIKGDIVAKSMKKSPKFAKFVHKRFAILSTIFTILFILSIIYSGIAIHDWIVYGNCNGPEDLNEFCMFNELTGGYEEVDCSDGTCVGECEEDETCNTDCGCSDSVECALG